MNLGLEGKRALVTGSTRGIGFAIARQLIDEGAAVCSDAARVVRGASWRAEGGIVRLIV